MLKNKLIKQKVTTVIMLTSSMVFLVTCIMFIAYELVTFRRAMVENLSTLAEITAVNSSGSLAFEDRKDANEVLAALRAKPHIVAASLYDRGGILFSRYPSDIPEDAVPGAPEKDGCRFENGHLVLFQPVAQSGRRLGTLYIKSNLNGMWERFQSYGVIVILVVAV